MLARPYITTAPCLLHSYRDTPSKVNKMPVQWFQWPLASSWFTWPSNRNEQLYFSPTLGIPSSKTFSPNSPPPFQPLCFGKLTTMHLDDLSFLHTLICFKIPLLSKLLSFIIYLEIKSCYFKQAGLALLSSCSSAKFSSSFRKLPAIMPCIL